MFSCNYSNLDLSQTNFNCIAQKCSEHTHYRIHFGNFPFLQAFSEWMTRQNWLKVHSYHSEIRIHFNRIPKLMTIFWMAYHCNSTSLLLAIFIGIADRMFSNEKIWSSQQQFWHTWIKSNQMRISNSINLPKLFQFSWTKCATCHLRKMFIHIHDVLFVNLIEVYRLSFGMDEYNMHLFVVPFSIPMNGKFSRLKLIRDDFLWFQLNNGAVYDAWQKFMHKSSDNMKPRTLMDDCDCECEPI